MRGQRFRLSGFALALRRLRWQQLASWSALGALAAPQLALGDPSGGSVTAGNVGISHGGNTTLVTQGSESAIVNWQTFSVGADEFVIFNQPSASSAILNRVIGGSPSEILGSISANGRVFLVNPQGVSFGEGAQVDVGSLLVSTLNIRDDDFLSGNYLFAGDSVARISNAGRLQAADGGFVALLGDQLSNSGLISARLGTVALVSGSEVALDFAGDGLLSYAINRGALSQQAGAANLGQIEAGGGRVVMAAQLAQSLAQTAVNNEGSIRAQGVAQRGGEIYLTAIGGDTFNSGTLDASNTGGQGGTVQVLGERVGLFGNAMIDASGASGGGTVLIGGDFQGGNPEIHNASRTFVGGDVSIVADAVRAGDGGKVVVWADDSTRFYGAISAQGGADGGDGGFTEVSGKQNLDFAGAVNLEAAQGQGGTLLLDPNTINLVQAGNSLPDNPTAPELLFTDVPGSDYDVDVDLVSGHVNLWLQAEQDIDIEADFDMSGDLRLEAKNNININANLTVAGATILTADYDNIGGGAILQNTGTVTLHDATLAGVYQYNAGSLVLNGQVTAGDGLQWNVSNDISGTGKLVLPAGEQFDINNAGSRNLFVDVDSSGQVNLNLAGNGIVYLGGGGQFHNQAGGVIEFIGTADGSDAIADFGGGTLLNEGAIRNSSASGVANISMSTFANIGATLGASGGGQLVVNASDISSSGNLTLEGNVVFAGGTVQMAAGSFVDGDFNQEGAFVTLLNSEFSGLYRYSSGTLSVDGLAEFQGGFDWLANADITGTAGTLKIPVGMVMNIGEAGTRSVSGTVTIENHGTVNIDMDASSVLYLNNGAAILNKPTGLIDFVATSDNGDAIGRNAGSGTISNYGIIRVSDNDSHSSLWVTNFDNQDEGQLQAPNGGWLDLAALDNQYFGTTHFGGNVSLYDGAHHFNTGSNVTGAISHQFAQVTLEDVTFQDFYSYDVGVNSGLTVNGTVNLNSGFDWNDNIGSSIGGTGKLVVPAGEIFDVNGTASRSISGITIDNGGTFAINIESAVALYVDNGAILNNLGTGIIDFTRTGSTYGDDYLAGSTNGVLNNAGLIRNSSGNGVAYVSLATFINNGGDLGTSAGTFLSIQPGTTASYLGNMDIAGSGVELGGGAAAHTFTGATSFTGLLNVNSAYVAIDGGTLTLGGDMIATDSVFFSGDLADKISVPFGLTLTAKGDSLTFDSLTVENSGTIDVHFDTGPGTLALDNGAVFNNNLDGVLDFTAIAVGDQNYVQTYNGVMGFFNNNAGTLRNSGQGSVQFILDDNFSSTDGSFDGLSGFILSNSVFTPVGYTTVSGGGTLVVHDLLLESGNTLYVDDGALDTNKVNVNEGGSLLLNGNALTATGSDIDIGGTLDLGAGGTINAAYSALLHDNGVLKGSGSIELGQGLTQTGGILQPGNSAGTLTIITGGYDQQGGTLEIEIGGLTPGSEHDQLVVQGDVSLDGDVEVVLLGGYVPAQDDEFEYLTANSIVLQAASVISPAEATFSPGYNLTGAIVVASPVSPPPTPPPPPVSPPPAPPPPVSPPPPPPVSPPPPPPPPVSPPPPPPPPVFPPPPPPTSPPPPPPPPVSPPPPPPPVSPPPPPPPPVSPPPAPPPPPPPPMSPPPPPVSPPPPPVSEEEEIIVEEEVATVQQPVQVPETVADSQGTESAAGSGDSSSPETGSPDQGDSASGKDKKERKKDKGDKKDSSSRKELAKEPLITTHETPPAGSSAGEDGCDAV